VQPNQKINLIFTLYIQKFVVFLYNHSMYTSNTLSMTENVFINQFTQMPEGIKQEILSFYEYLTYKYQIQLPLERNTEPSEKAKTTLEPNQKPLKAGFLKGTFVMADDFDAPLDDFKEYM
jgi:hypothetical protein